MLDEAEVVRYFDDLRALVQGDGADFTLVAVDPATRAVRVRLEIEDASCQECVLPRDFLEQVALDAFRRLVPAVQQVSIDDPRETQAPV
ncbi:hypothetical protein [Parafrankia elaeagni]|uniref:hypothetical protein n=1 Tax=Parafrankia elaeagni TaxID=222534 RepID=UPI00036D1BDE|nr:hypothetical protein [Parafrankia elaeagni]